MSRPMAFMIGCAFVTIPMLALAACSRDVDTGVADDDASSVILPNDAASAPDVEDTGYVRDADAEAGTRLCSDDHFCHSVVPKGQVLTGVWSDGQGATWAVSSTGDILRWDGTSWKVHQHVAGTDEIFSIFGTGPTDIWVATMSGLVHGSGENSASLVFAPVTLPGDGTVVVKSLWGTGPNDVWAVGGAENWEEPFAVGLALHYSGSEEDGGGGWAVDADLGALGIAFRGVWGSEGSGVWLHGRQADELGAFTGVVLRREPGSATWMPVELPPETSTPEHPGPQYFVAASMSSDSSVWLAGFAGGESVSARWQGTRVQGGGSGYVWTYTKRNYWDRTIEAMWGAATDDAWVIGDDGLVEHWNGSAWAPSITRVTELPVPNRFLGIWARNSDDMWIVGDEIALHRTTSDRP